MRSYTNYNLGEIDDEMESILLIVSMTACTGALQAQVTVKHIQTDKSPIATGVWAGDTFYLSGQLASPILERSLAEQHRWIPDSGWTTFRIRDNEDVQHAIFLMRLSYIYVTRSKVCC